MIRPPPRSTLFPYTTLLRSHSRLMTKRNRSRSALRLAASVFLALMGAAYSHSQETSSVTLPEIEIRTLANRILQGAGKSDCKPGDCSILVANFTLPSGATSPLGDRKSVV